MKLAIITGASTGIGYAAAIQFIQKGFNVINVSRRQHDHQAVVNHCCDLSDKVALSSLAALLAQEVKHADEVTLVHNAGYLAGDSALAPNETELETMLAVNVWAPTLLNKALLKVMPRNSSVLYVGSTLSEKAVAGSYSYVLSKHAVTGMMKASCQDLFGLGIHTACICPGFTDTIMLRTHIPDDEVLQTIGANNGFSRLVEPNEIAQLIVWAHHNPAINGSVLHANLGQKEY